MVGQDAAWEYYASRPAQKGGMRQEVFDTVAWDDVKEAIKERSKMFKMWYAKQGSGNCGVATERANRRKRTKRQKRRS